MSLKLNIGAGATSLPGFENVDVKEGRQAFPLEVANESVDEIYASHVLEHFPYEQSEAILKDWASKLKPGGRMKIAVPDIRKIAAGIVAGTLANAGAYIYGGHVDQYDHHKAGFDQPGLHWLMERAGLVGIRRWVSDIQDCASLPISLNLEGWKPQKDLRIGERVCAVMTTPRYGPMSTAHCVTNTCQQLGIPLFMRRGAYFDQCLEWAMENHDDREFILAMDYDGLWGPSSVERLICLMDQYPEAGAIAAMQARRGDNIPLLVTGPMTLEDLYQDVLEVKSMHFGLTAIRTSELRKMTKPWLEHKAGKNGWDADRVDADVRFWHKMAAETGSKVYITPRVNIGHIDEMAVWLGPDLKPIYQHVGEFFDGGMNPPEGLRC